MRTYGSKQQYARNIVANRTNSSRLYLSNFIINAESKKARKYKAKFTQLSTGKGMWGKLEITIINAINPNQAFKILVQWVLWFLLFNMLLRSKDHVEIVIVLVKIYKIILQNATNFCNITQNPAVNLVPDMVAVVPGNC